MKFGKLIAILGVGMAVLSAQELTLERADQCIESAVAKAGELQINIAVAVVDCHGNLKAFKRMDGTPLVTCESSRMKAFTSASFPCTTQQLADLSVENPHLGDIAGFLLLGGGVPILSPSGEHLGGIGVGGGTAEQDEQCASAGLID